MTLKELKDWASSLPKDFDNYTVVNATIVDFDEDEFSIRFDKPVTALSVDEENEEICILNDEIKD